MTEAADPTPQDRMNALYHRLVTGIRTNAERDLRLAHAAGNAADQARAQARLDIGRTHHRRAPPLFVPVLSMLVLASEAAACLVQGA